MGRGNDGGGLFAKSPPPNPLSKTFIHGEELFSQNRIKPLDKRRKIRYNQKIKAMTERVLGKIPREVAESVRIGGGASH